MFQPESTQNCYFLPAYLEMVSHIFLADEMSNPKKGIPPQNGEKTNKQTKTPSELFFLRLQLSNKLKAII